MALDGHWQGICKTNKTSQPGRRFHAARNNLPKGAISSYFLTQQREQLTLNKANMLVDGVNSS